MQLQRVLVAVFVTAVAVASAQAQILGKISANATSVKTGEAVTVTANIDVISGNYCGFVVDFGDNNRRDGVSDQSNATPLVLQHTYAKAGVYHVTLGGRNVQNHPNCGGEERAIDVTVTEAKGLVAAEKPSSKADASTTCPVGWKLVPKSLNKKTGAFGCFAKPGTALPEIKTSCKGDLTYFENAKKGQLGCRP